MLSTEQLISNAIQTSMALNKAIVVTVDTRANALTAVSLFIDKQISGQWEQAALPGLISTSPNMPAQPMLDIKGTGNGIKWEIFVILTDPED